MTAVAMMPWLALGTAWAWVACRRDTSTMHAQAAATTSATHHSGWRQTIRRSLSETEPWAARGVAAMLDASGVEQADATRTYVSGLLLAGVHGGEGYAQVLRVPLPCLLQTLDDARDVKGEGQPAPAVLLVALGGFEHAEHRDLAGAPVLVLGGVRPGGQVYMNQVAGGRELLAPHVLDLQVHLAGLGAFGRGGERGSGGSFDGDLDLG